MRFRTFAFAAMMAVGLAATTAEAQQPVKIRIAWVVPVANSPTILYEIPSILKHKGKSYDIDLVRFQGTPPMITALQAGELDIALFAFSTFALAVQNANMQDLRVIADEAQEGVDGYFTGPYNVLKDSPIQKIQDLKGKVIASVGPGAAVDIAMRAALKRAGLEDKRDYTVVEAGFPNMRAMLADKKADLITSVLPFAGDPELLKIARPLFTVRDALQGPSQFVVWAARESFLQKNKDVMNDLMEDSARALHFYMDPKNREQFLEVASRVSKQPASAFGFAYTKNDLYRDPNFRPNLESLQRAVDVLPELGLLKAKMDVTKYADLSYVEEAARRLK
ncbi:MAG: ABC transporter substrate-binding protein [Xanthobacteraceae bacterium]|nr:ABC transporter substrate-binding protein [Xanthobacteraceae bacterium]